jgi:adenylate kinase family enzyme
MLREAMVAAKAAGGGFVLDGIPRNMQQARAAYLMGRELGMTADVALHLQANRRGRASGRRLICERRPGMVRTVGGCIGPFPCVRAPGRG